MTTLKYKDELISKLKDKEYRDAFVSSHINNGIPFQIKTLRGELTQEELGKLADIKQEAICRLENPNYGSFTISTLKKLASALDVALIVRFVPFGDLVEWDINLSSATLKVARFDNDPYFHERESRHIEDQQQYTTNPQAIAANNEISIMALKEPEIDSPMKLPEMALSA